MALDRQHKAAHHDRALANIQTANRPRHLDGPLNIALVAGQWGNSAQDANRQGQVVDHLVRALNLKAFLLKLTEQEAQKPVITLARRRDYTGKSG